MPVLLLGVGALGLGAGIKMAGDGVDDAGNGSVKLAVALAVCGAAYYVMRKKL